MKKIRLMALGAVLVLVLAGCSAYGAQPNAPAAAPTNAPVAGQPAAGQPAVILASNDTLGNILVDAKGMTLYTYAKDTANTSNCTGSCATNWPPLTVAQGITPTAGPGVTGALGVITRADGTSQVTLDGKPLYYFAKDTKPGDATGEGVLNVWYVVQLPAANAAPGGQPAAAAGLPTVMVASSGTLGNILVDGKGMTLYTFKQDTANTSNCTGGCATAWPPLTVAKGATPTAGPGVTGTLGVIQRADGTYQVTLDGKPLYYFANDAKPGDATGQGLNSVWFVVQLPAATY